MKITAVILAGGAGTRLWPISRDDKPKQFHNLTGEGTLLNMTLKRLIPLNPDLCLITTSQKYKDISKAEIREAGIKGEVLAEPEPKNTAPAILNAALYLNKIYDDSIMIVLPADHYIKKEKAFRNTLKAAIEEAMKGRLVTIGIKPDSPETGYGYIKAEKNTSNVRNVQEFVEKPDKKTAEKYIKNGNYFWNAGIFVWKTSTILSWFEKLMPETCNSFKPVKKIKAEDIVSNEKKAYKKIEKIFSSVESISIDYGIMEKAENKAVIPADLGWTDLGNWSSIDSTLPSDKNNNRGFSDNLIFISSNNCTVFTEGKTIALVGLDNIVVAESDGNILVMNKDHSQNVRKVVEKIKNRKK
ncbi:MAG: mannose-1-phosphate guanylyltransferase [Spirochaetes bacterium]|nr:mannose-1-phosphate guanylyltransferase [Spirochaetota bacterium]